MTEYTLKYFPLKAMGEGIRLLFAYGGEKFEDRHVLHQEWQLIKSSAPFGTMPILEIDGRVYSESIAICRYLGRKYGLVGSDELEDLEIDMVMDAIVDFRKQLQVAYYETDATIRANKYNDLKERVVPFFLSRFDAIAAQNNGHLALGKITWADLYFTGMYDYLVRVAGKDIAVEAPNLRKVVDNVLELPVIQEFYKTVTTTMTF